MRLPQYKPPPLRESVYVSHSEWQHSARATTNPDDNARVVTQPGEHATLTTTQKIAGSVNAETG